MHITSQMSTRTRFFQSVWAGLLIVGLLFVGAGCDGGGASDGEGDEPEPTIPEAPSGLEATSGSAEVVLTWEAPAEAEEYAVYRATASGVDPSEEALAEGIEEPAYTDDAVQNGTTYFYRVTAMADEEGDASSEVEVTPFDEPPTRPE